MYIINREGRPVTYHVDVSTRNSRGEPIRAAVRTDEGAVAVVCRRTVFGWEPLYGLDLGNGNERDLPSCFTLHPDALRALELAL